MPILSLDDATAKPFFSGAAYALAGIAPVGTIGKVRPPGGHAVHGTTPVAAYRSGGAEHVAMATDPLPLVSDAVKSAAPTLHVTVTTEASALAEMALAAHSVLARHFSDGDPVRVVVVGAQDRQHVTHRIGSRYIRASRTGDGHPRVELTLPQSRTLGAAEVAAAVAVGLAGQRHPITGSGNRPERIRLQRKALHVVTQTEHSPKAPTVDAVLEEKRPDTSPLATAIRAAEEARDGRSVAGASADAGLLPGARFVVLWDAETEDGAPTQKRMTIPRAGDFTAEHAGLPIVLVAELTLASGETTRITQAVGRLAVERRDPKTRKPVFALDPAEAAKALKR